MRYLKFFEAWSSKFHKDLQDAYEQAELTNKGHGKIKKDILAYTTRQVSEEKFTLVISPQETNFTSCEIDFYIDPEFLLKASRSPKQPSTSTNEVKDITVDLVPTEVRLEYSNGGKMVYSAIRYKKGNYAPLQMKIYTQETKPYIYLYNIDVYEVKMNDRGDMQDMNQVMGLSDNSWNVTKNSATVRFKTKRMLEDFITMVTKAMLTTDNIEQNKALLQKLIDTNQNYFL